MSAAGLDDGASALTREAVDRLDRAGMLGDVLAQPAQLEDARWRAESAAIPPRDLAGGVVVCGMGGSAVGADLAAAALRDRATRPVRTVRGYELEPWTPVETLVVCSSYSGATEETLACFEAAGALGAPRVAMTTGGPLAEAARAEGVPVIGLPSGMQPRASVIYMIVGVLECAARAGAGPSLGDELDGAEDRLSALVDEWGPDTPDDSLAKSLAHSLHGAVPVIHGAGPTAAVARRWKTQLNENPEMAAFVAELPEADHNEICAWERGRELAPLVGVFLCDPDQHPRLQRRMALTAVALEDAGAPAHMVEARGETPLDRVLSLVLLGDLVSVYLAALEGVDPSPVEPIERFKRALD